MISYDEAGRVLDEAVDSLPEEIFRYLNGGVNLIRGGRTDEYGLLVMGTYNVNQMGRYIEIYYGSFKLKYPNEMCIRDRLVCDARVSAVRRGRRPGSWRSSRLPAARL